MADLKERRRRWRGPTLGGPLQRGARFCFAAHDGEASTARLTEWCRPELVGGRVKKWHLSNQERALQSIGARKVRRDGRGWVGDWMTVMGRQRNRERSRDRLVTGDDGSLGYLSHARAYRR